MSGKTNASGKQPKVVVLIINAHFLIKNQQQ